MNRNDAVIKALAELRIAVHLPRSAGHTVQDAFNVLDDAGVFSEIDEETGYEDPSDTLARLEGRTAPRKDPAEWGDLTGYADLGQVAAGYVAAADRLRTLRYPTA